MGAFLTFLSIFGKVSSVLPLAVSIAETIAGVVKPGQKTGMEKLASVQQVVHDAVQSSNLIAGKQIIDEDLFNQGVTDMVNAAVKIMNATKPKN